MKKLLSLVACLAILFSFSGCQRTTLLDSAKEYPVLHGVDYGMTLEEVTSALSLDASKGEKQTDSKGISTLAFKDVTIGGVSYNLVAFGFWDDAARKSQQGLYMIQLFYNDEKVLNQFTDEVKTMGFADTTVTKYAAKQTIYDLLTQKSAYDQYLKDITASLSSSEKESTIKGMEANLKKEAAAYCEIGDKENTQIYKVTAPADAQYVAIFSGSAVAYANNYSK